MTVKTSKKCPGLNNCPYLVCPDDDPTKIATLGWRFVMALVGWFILGYGISLGNSFFVSLTLYAAPLLIDYFKFKPKTKFRRIQRTVGIIFSFIWVFVGFLGMSNILIVNIRDMEAYISVSNHFVVLGGHELSTAIIWFSMGISVLLTGIDWLANVSPMEKQLVSE